MTLAVQRELAEWDMEQAAARKAEIEAELRNATFAGDLFRDQDAINRAVQARCKVGLAKLRAECAARGISW